MVVVEEIKESESFLLDKTYGDLQTLLPPKAMEAYIEYVKELQKLNFNDEEIRAILTVESKNK